MKKEILSLSQIEKIARSVRDHTEVDWNQMFSTTKAPILVLSRQLFYYLCEEYGAKRSDVIYFVYERGIDLAYSNLLYAHRSMDKKLKQGGEESELISSYLDSIRDELKNKL